MPSLETMSLTENLYVSLEFLKAQDMNHVMSSFFVLFFLQEVKPAILTNGYDPAKAKIFTSLDSKSLFFINDTKMAQHSPTVRLLRSLI